MEHRLAGLYTTEFFSPTVLESRKSKIKAWAGVWGGPATWLIDSCLLTVPSHCRRVGGSRGFFNKGTGPIRGLSSQRPHLPIPSHWGLGFQHVNLGGDTNIESVALPSQLSSVLFSHRLVRSFLRLHCHLSAQAWCEVRGSSRGQCVTVTLSPHCDSDSNRFEPLALLEEK